MSISRIFDIGGSSLSTYQKALDVSAHNIANADNTDYTRQVVNFKANTANLVNGTLWGTGVTLDNIQRARNSLIDSQLRNNNSEYSANDQTNSLLGEVEQLFSEPSELGVSNLTTSFFNSWQELAVTPNSTTLRSDVINAGKNLASKLNSINNGLDVVKSDIIGQMKTKVDSLNSDLKQLQQLNTQIFQFQTMGYDPSDLLDSRDKVIDDLSNLGNINISYDSSNSAIVSFGGVFAADRTTAAEFSLSEVNGNMTITSNSSDAPVRLQGGQIQALSNVYSNVIPSYEDKLDKFTQTLTDSVNALHSSAYSVNTPPQTGLNFFNYQAGKLSVSELLIDDPQKISISSDGTSGDGKVAQKIADLSNAKSIDGSTLGDFYSSFISQVGNDTSLAQQKSEASKLVIDQLNEQKTSYSGVSSDEEMSNILKFQKSYAASAKLITIADSMIQTILNMVGTS